MGMGQTRELWQHLVTQITTQVSLHSLQTIKDAENKRREKRKSGGKRDAVVLNYTDETGQRKKMRLTITTTSNLYI